MRLLRGADGMLRLVGTQTRRRGARVNAFTASSWGTSSLSSARARTSGRPPAAGAATLICVILRIWHATIDPARAEQYERFARERSLPMFRSHHGFSGCALLRSGADCTLVTLWATPEDVAALEASA